MTSQKEVPIFHPIVHSRSLTLSGGYHPGKKYVPSTRMFPCIRGSGVEDIVDKECVLVTHKEPWLCEMATGQCPYQRPLARSRIVREMCAIMCASPADIQMAALAFEDENSDMETPVKKPRVRKPKVSSTATSSVVEAPLCRPIQVPEQMSSLGQKISVYAALDERRRLWLHVDSLPWLLRYVKEEKDCGGVPPVASPPALPEESRIYWNFRDDSWIARARNLNGNWLRTSRYIKRRQKVEGVSFQALKEAAFHDMEAWVASVERGDIIEVETILLDE